MFNQVTKQFKEDHAEGQHESSEDEGDSPSPKKPRMDMNN